MKLTKLILTLTVLAAGAAGCGGSSSSASNPPMAVIPPPDVTVVDANGNTSIDPISLLDQLALLPLGVVSAEEEAGLIFMREEEKLAHDVYIQLNTHWQQAVFANIAVSELTHTEAVLLLLQRYTISDPVGSNPAGVFVDPALQGLYDILVARGSATLIDALMVGAEVEELDIFDLDLRLATVVDNDDIVLVYENLKKGSRNHLRAFMSALTQLNATYTPQYLSQEEFDEIVNSPIETGGPG